MKFRLVPPELGARLPALRKAYVTGPDRTPVRAPVELRPGLLTVHRDSSESGRFHVPWPVDGFGQPVVGTATLGERAGPYDLAVELARGRLNDVLNQLADWRQMGLAVPTSVGDALARSRSLLAKAVTTQGLDAPSADAAGSLEASFRAGRDLVSAYADGLLRRRLDGGSPLPTAVACALSGNPKASTWASRLPEAFTAARVRLGWGIVEPDEGKRRWDEAEAQIQWCRKQGLDVAAGPLLELRPGAMPDWLVLWEGDFDEIQSQALDFVRQAMTRFGGKVSTWHLVHRPASAEILGLSEEEQIRLTAQVVQVARRICPDATLVVDLDRPWAEWMAQSGFQLGPLHLADSLARAELGLGGIGLEIAPGYSAPGSLMRDIFDFSRLLDLYALVNLPLHVSIALPSSGGRADRSASGVEAELAPWCRPPDEALQEEMGMAWISLAAAKPFVRSVTWLQASDPDAPVFPHSGLLRPDGTPKPLFESLKAFRARALRPNGRG